MTKKEFKLKQKTQKESLLRPLRVVKCLEFPYILQNSPVEVEDGYIVSDTDKWDIFATFIFKNVSDLPITNLNIKIAFYYNQNIPYKYIDFSFRAEDLTFGYITKGTEEYKLADCNKRNSVCPGESFGKYVLVPIPESYFTKIDLILDSVEYENGETEKLNIKVGGKSSKFSDLDNISKLVYTKVNVYEEAEYTFPTLMVPQFGEKSWLCCCGNKNSNTDNVCTKCGREMEWQKNTTSAENLEKTKEELVADPKEVTLHDKSRFSQNKMLENKYDIENKIKSYEKAKENLVKDELAKKARSKRTIRRVIVTLLTVGLLITILSVIRDFKKAQFRLNGCEIEKIYDNSTAQTDNNS